MEGGKGGKGGITGTTVIALSINKILTSIVRETQAKSALSLSD